MLTRTPPRSRYAATHAVSPTAPRDLDRIDREILKRLQHDGRMTISQLAREVHLTTTPCFDRVRRLEAAGYINGYFAQLNAHRLGLTLLAFIAVRIDRTSTEIFDRFREAISTFDEVLECHMVGGGCDYLIKVRVKDMHAFRRFLGDRMAAIRGVQQTHTYFVMEEVKSTHTISLPP